MRIRETAVKRSPSQRTVIIQKLRKAGKKGMLNTDLVKIGIGYRTRISELYKMGYVIDCTYESKGVCRYTLKAEPEVERELDTVKAYQVVYDKIEQLRGFIKKEELMEFLEENNFQIVRKNGSYK